MTERALEGDHRNWQRLEFSPVDLRITDDLEQYEACAQYVGSNGARVYETNEGDKCVRIEKLGVFDKKRLAIATNTIVEGVDSIVQLDELEIGVVYHLEDTAILVGWRNRVEESTPDLLIFCEDPGKVIAS